MRCLSARLLGRLALASNARGSGNMYAFKLIFNFSDTSTVADVENRSSHFDPGAEQLCAAQVLLGPKLGPIVPFSSNFRADVVRLSVSGRTMRDTVWLFCLTQATEKFRLIQPGSLAQLVEQRTLNP